MNDKVSLSIEIKFDDDLIVDSLSKSRLKSVRLLVEESDADVTSTANR
jgi:hypothetical protein